MCGIYGMTLGYRTDTDLEKVRKLMTMLALTSAERGTDATGIAIMSEDAVTHSHKDIHSAYEMVHKKRWREALAGISPTTRYILGHTRRATKGENIAVNSHPFQFVGEYGLLTGVHNGTITNHQEFKPTDTFQVDSANVLWAISETSIQKWGELLTKLRGSYALVWVRNGVMYSARNDDSPLATAWCPTLGSRIFASTTHMIAMSAAYAGVEISDLWEMSSGVLRGYSSLNVLVTHKQFEHTSRLNSWGDWGEEYDYRHRHLQNRFNGESWDYVRGTSTKNSATEQFPISTDNLNKKMMCATCDEEYLLANMYAYGQNRAQCYRCRQRYDAISRTRGGQSVTEAHRDLIHMGD